MIKAWVRNERFWVPVIEKIWLVFFALFSLFCAVLYSVHNTDPHHWAFIAGTALDHLRGRLFFKEIYIQYGVGEPIFFGLLSRVLPINYTTVGIYTSVFYLASQILLYFGVKGLTSSKIALATSLLSFLMHPFSIYPWPDYYAGFFLILGCFWMKGSCKASLKRDVFVGTCFAIAFLFRNTYAVGFIAAVFAYAVVYAINPRVRNKHIAIIFCVCFGLIGAYLCSLYMQDNLVRWFEQTLAAGQNEYGMGLHSVFDLLKNALFPSKFWLPNQLVRLTLSGLLYISVYVILTYVLKRDASKKWEVTNEPGVTLLFALLALAGIVQGALIFEVFRMQNSSCCLYFVAAIVVNAKYPDFFSVQIRNRKLKVAIVIYLVLMLAKIPRASALWPLWEGDLNDYSTTNIPFLKWHRYQSDQKEFLERMQTLICDGKSSITNLTVDPNMAYLCEGQHSSMPLPYFFPGMQKRIDPERYHQVVSGDFQENEIIVSDNPVPTNSAVKLNKIATLVRPASTRYPGCVPVSVYRAQRISR